VTRQAQPDNPGVQVPPPLFYVAAMTAGVLLNREMPLPIGGGAIRVAAAWALVAAFAALLASSFQTFWSRHTSVVPVRPATTLVIAGPYRFTRNPMYVGMALLTAGMGLWRDTWWVFVLLIPVVLVIDRYVIAREERYLRRRFGSAYDDYTRRVRRWL
jgi:protein-S-isoprenylcysteine O-methyltransferase Ste14